MSTHVIYCSACDREVPVFFEGEPRPLEPAGPEVDPSGICLAYCSEQCTGSQCALFDLPPAKMAAKLKAAPASIRPDPTT